MHIKTRKTTSCKTGLSSSMLLADIKKTAKTLGTTRLTKAQYLKHGSYSEATVSRRFGSWTKAMEIAGLKSGIYYPVSEYELLLNIGEVWKKTGQQPRLTDMKIPVSRYGSWTYKTHFGSWSIALVKFNSYAKSKRICLPISKNEIARSNNHYKSNSHSPKRKINLALRYSILKRDNYRCCACGRSPANHFGLELQIDHIIPFSKGGKSTFNNLQTLCSDCNYGKGDRY